MSCIFCAIVAGQAPAAVVHQDDRILAIMDIAPVSRGHVLVIPKRHAENIFETPAEDLIAVTAVARRIALAIRSEWAPAGLGVFQLNGAAAGQTVFHYHMHLIPRADGEPFVLHGRKLADLAELQQQASCLAAALAAID